MKRIIITLLLVVTLLFVFCISSSASTFPIGGYSPYILNEGYYNLETDSNLNLDLSMFDTRETIYDFPFYLYIDITVGSAVVYCDQLKIDRSQPNIPDSIIFRMRDYVAYNVQDPAYEQEFLKYLEVYKNDTIPLIIQGQGFIYGMSSNNTHCNIFIPQSLYTDSALNSFIQENRSSSKNYDFFVPSWYTFTPSSSSTNFNQIFKRGFASGEYAFNNIRKISGNVYYGYVSTSDPSTSVELLVYSEGEWIDDTYQFIRFIDFNCDYYGAYNYLIDYVTFTPYAYDEYQSYTNGYDEGYNLGYVGGYDSGYDYGYNDGQADSITTGFFLGIINTLDSLSIGPISVFDIIITLLGLFVLGWVLKLIAGG